MIDEKLLLAELKHGNQAVFTLIFKKYYRDLVIFGLHFIHDKSVCEDMVQNIFCKLWQNRESLEITTSLRSFLIRSIRNNCLDELRHRKVIREHEASETHEFVLMNLDTEQYVLYSDLQDHLDRAIGLLPQDCREAFRMHRIEGLKYREIAKKLNVSERTVEVRIGRSIGLLRTQLKAFLSLLLLLLK